METVIKTQLHDLIVVQNRIMDFLYWKEIPLVAGTMRINVDGFLPFVYKGRPFNQTWCNAERCNGIIIEYNGLQHYVEWNLHNILPRDEVRRKVARRGGYKIVYIPFYMKRYIQQYLLFRLYTSNIILWNVPLVLPRTEATRTVGRHARASTATFRRRVHTVRSASRLCTILGTGLYKLTGRTCVCTPVEPDACWTTAYSHITIRFSRVPRDLHVTLWWNNVLSNTDERRIIQNALQDSANRGLHVSLWITRNMMIQTFVRYMFCRISDAYEDVKTEVKVQQNRFDVCTLFESRK